MHKKLNLELTRELKKFKPPQISPLFFGENYIGGNESKLIFWNIRVPDVRSLLKKALCVFSEPLEIQFDAFERIWFDSNIFEIKSISIHWLEGLKTEQLAPFATRLVMWANAIDNWGHSDPLCGIYARLMEIKPAFMQKTYNRWSKSKNPWLRRCSMVGVFYYSRSRKKQPTFNFALSMVKPNLNAPEYYVQKGVGWTIREMFNVYPKETLQFIEANLLKIRPDAWYATTEKLPRDLKDKLVTKRRIHRKKDSA